MGLIPEGIAPERIRYQGNTSLAGARLTALSEGTRQQTEELARRTEHIDLSTDHGFQWAFADAMIALAQKAQDDPEFFHDAPTTTPVSRLDEVAAARNLDVSFS